MMGFWHQISAGRRLKCGLDHGSICPVFIIISSHPSRHRIRDSFKMCHEPLVPWISTRYFYFSTVKEQRNILHEIRKRKANWIGHILHRNCLLQRVIEGKIQGRLEVTGRRGRRRTKLLDDLKKRRGYFHMKEEALDHTMWRARFGRGLGPVVRQTAKWMNEHSLYKVDSVVK